MARLHCGGDLEHIPDLSFHRRMTGALTGLTHEVFATGGGLAGVIEDCVVGDGLSKTVILGVFPEKVMDWDQCMCFMIFCYSPVRKMGEVVLMVTKPQHQGQDLATQLVWVIEDYAEILGLTRVFARTTSTSFGWWTSHARWQLQNREPSDGFVYPRTMIYHKLVSMRLWKVKNGHGRTRARMSSRTHRRSMRKPGVGRRLRGLPASTISTRPRKATDYKDHDQ